jgi:hypothetical protein
MKRRWNLLLWIGFGIVILGLVSYIPLFALFPITRDVPWVNYLLFFAGGLALVAGLKRAFSEPERYRGRISGSILSVLSLLLVGFFCFGMLYASKQIPAAHGSPPVGQPAPAFVLTNTDGKEVAWADLLKDNRGALLIFYRGYW